MDRNSFSLKSLAGNSPRQIPASASEAPKASQPSRLLFSSFESLDRLPNTGSSSEIANQISPGLLNDRARLNKPLSMLRFGAVHTNSSHSDDCMGTRKDSQDSRDHFDSGEIESSTDIANYPDTGRNARNATDNNITDINNTSQGIVTEGDAQYEEKDSQRQGHHPDPSFSCLEEILDSLWDLSRVPMQLQREIQIVKDHMHNQSEKIAKEQLAFVKVSSDLEHVQRDAQSLKRNEKEYKAKIIEMQRSLHESSSNIEQLQKELQCCKGEASREHELRNEMEANKKRELQDISNKLRESNDLLTKKKAVNDKICQELSFVQRCIEDEIGKRENVESERDAVKLLSVKLQNKLDVSAREWEAQKIRNKKQIDELQKSCEEGNESSKNLAKAMGESSEANKVLLDELEQVGRFARNIFSVQEQFDKVRKLCTTNYKLPLKNLELENLLSWEDESSESLVQARKYSKNTSSGMDITKVMEFAEMYIKDLFQKVVFREAVFTRYVSMSESGFQNVFKNQTEASIQVKQAQKDLHELNQELCSLKEDAASFKGIMYRAFEVFEQYRIDLYDKATDLKKQNSNLKIELECCQSDLSKLKEALQYTKSTSDETIRTLQEENKVEVDKGASTAIQIKEYGEEVKHIKAEMENNKKASETVCADLKQRLLDETRKNVDISKELNKYLSKLRDLEEESVCLTKMAHSTKEENELLVSKIRKELSSAVESNNDLTKKLGEANNEKEALSKRVSEAEATKLLAEQRLHEKELGNQKTIEELRSVQEQLAATTSQKVRNDDCGDHALVGCVRETTKDVEENAPPNCLRARVGEETTRDENVSTEKVQVSRPTSLKDRGEHLKNMTERLKKKSAMKSPRKNLKPKRLRSSISKTAPPSRKRAAAGNGAKDTTHNPIYSHGTLRRNAEEDDDWVVDATLG